MAKNKYDLLVIGAGSGGIAAGRRAASYGAKVAIIEYDRLGGTCVNRGCVPKKLLVYSSRFPAYFEEARGYGWQSQTPSHNWHDLVTRVTSEVLRLNGIYQNLLEKSGVDLISGYGKFVDNQTVSVHIPGEKQAVEILTGDKILIATGSKPSRPTDIPGIEYCLTSDEIFNLAEKPKKMAILGGGYIGSEFSCLLNLHGVQITQIIRSDHILSGFDEDIRKEVQQAMINAGIEVINRSQKISIQKLDQSYNLHIVQESGVERNFQLDTVALAALGRQPNLQHLGLENTTIAIKDGAIEVDDLNKTNLDHVFAVGDCINKENLTPVAIKQGRIFSDRYYGNQPDVMSYHAIPTAIFTTPEAATVGLSEQDAIAKYGKQEIQVFKTRFRSMYYTLPDKDTKTLMKLVVHKTSDRVLGAHMVGDHAAEIIQGLAIPIKMGASKKDFDSTVAVHPSAAEEFVTMV